jgi:hypothetical protein
MWWLAIAAGVFFFRGKIAALLSRFFPGLFGSDLTSHFELYGHLACVTGSLLFPIPLGMFGLGAIKHLAWLVALWGHGSACMAGLAKNYGKDLPNMPKIDFKNWRQGMQGAAVEMQPFLQKTLKSPDFHFLFFVLIFLAADQTVLVVLLIARRSLWTLCTKWSKESPATFPMRSIWPMMEPRWKSIKASGQADDIVEKCNLGEVCFGFWLVISLFLPNRQIFACILYWHFLKIRYQAEKHHKAWQLLAQKSDPLFKAVPILQKPLGWAKGFFQPQVQYQYQPR